MPMGPVDNKSPAHPYFDPLWEILNEAKITIAFHVSEANFMHPVIHAWGEKPLQSRRIGQTAWQWMFCYSELPVQMTLANIIYHNFFERFPEPRIVSVENGANWLPAFLNKMDKMRGMAKNGFWPCGQLKERPSAIFKRHCAAVAYPEDDVKGMVERLGSTAGILMGSDYPHAEGVIEPRAFYNEALSELTDAEVRQIMYDNAKNSDAHLTQRNAGITSFAKTSAYSANFESGSPVGAIIAKCSMGARARSLSSLAIAWPGVTIRIVPLALNASRVAGLKSASYPMLEAR